MALNTGKKTLGLLLAGLLPFPAKAAPPLTITYIEKPPYYYTDAHGKPAGFLLERVRRALAGQAISLETRSPQWAQEEIRRNTHPVCSIGWFSDDYRRSFAQFSAPIYRDKALVAVFHKKPDNTLFQAKTLKNLLAQNIKIGTVGGFSYGDKVNPLLSRQGDKKRVVSDEEANLHQLLRHEVDVILLSPETLKYFREKQAFHPADIRVRHYPDIPPGLERYLICSQKTPKAMIEHFNQALQR